MASINKQTVLASLSVTGLAWLAWRAIKGTKKRCERFPVVNLTLPDWVADLDEAMFKKAVRSDDELMHLAVLLSARNVAENTGGPFGSVIYRRDLNDDTTEVVAVGVNRVVPQSNSTAHGEVVAFQMAQSVLGSFSLRSDENVRYELFTSCEPCAMCLGATCWSGVQRIVCAATKDDAEAIGFSEGPVFPESYAYMESQGIAVKRNVLRQQAANVLAEYGRIGEIYNA